MACKIKHGSVNNGSASGVVGHIGDNCVVKDMPCLIPKENMKFLNQMQKNAGQQPFPGWPSPFHAFWNDKH